MGLLSEFREFAVKGNVVDLAVGVIIGGAFATITNWISTLMKAPYSMTAGAPLGLVGLTGRVIFRSAKSIPPISQPMGGMMI